jgi:hypothetical protein
MKKRTKLRIKRKKLRRRNIAPIAKRQATP